MSREATQAAMAREAYHKHMQPAQYGVHMHNIRDIPATQTIVSPSSRSKVNMNVTSIQKCSQQITFAHVRIITKHCNTFEAQYCLFLRDQSKE